MGTQLELEIQNYQFIWIKDRKFGPKSKETKAKLAILRTGAGNGSYGKNMFIISNFNVLKWLN
jgi:hypothetical protein